MCVSHVFSLGGAEESGASRQQLPSQTLVSSMQHVACTSLKDGIAGHMEGCASMKC